jgi:RHS repeat-associated protein
MAINDPNDATKSQTCTYSADELSRIASVNCGNSTWAQNFTYDAFGNIQKTGSSNYIAAYSTVTNQVSGGPSYDANGNQLTSTPATLTWNALNLPISVNSTTATYDALGRMVEKGSGGTYTQFVFSPAGTLLALYSGGLVKGTIPLPGGGTAIYNGSGLNYIRHKDWLGSSRLATTWAHAVYSKEAYAPFGETYYEAGTPDRSFTGQDQDVVTGSGGTGVYDYLFRKYDPSAGRWLSPDPSGWTVVSPPDPQSLNRYAYVENMPTNAFDPNGLDCAYLADDGVTLESNDQNSDPIECAKNGGYWVNGSLTDLNVNVNTGVVTLIGTLDGTDETGAQYSNGQNTNPITAYMDDNGNVTFHNPSAPDTSDPIYQLAQGLNQTGIYSLTSVCAPVAFYGASAAGAGGAVAVANIGPISAAASDNAPTLLAWGYRLLARTGTAPGIVATVTTLYKLGQQLADQANQFCSSH